MADKEQIKSNSLWREKLTPEQFYVCREKGTEPAFSGAYTNEKTNGLYLCICCDAPLFDSNSKYDSGSGWPSFFRPINNKAIREEEDLTHGMRRVEVLCQECGSHLGHLFPDGPAPSGLRYCINSISLKLLSSNQNN